MDHTLLSHTYEKFEHYQSGNQKRLIEDRQYNDRKRREVQTNNCPLNTT